MNYRNIIAIAATFTFAVVSFGCGGAATNTTTTVNKGNTTTTTTTNTTTTTTNSAPANTSASNSEIKADASEPGTGVAECDEYIKKYEACLTKVAKQNPQAEAAARTAFKAQRDGFKAAAATPQGKTVLATQCKQAVDTAKSQMTAYACEW